MGNQQQLPVQHANVCVLVKCLNPENLNCHLKKGLFPWQAYVQSVLKYFWDSEPVLHLHSSNTSDLLLEGGLVPGYSTFKTKQQKTKATLNSMQRKQRKTHDKYINKFCVNNMKNKHYGSSQFLYHYVLPGFMSQYCIALFSKYHFKGSMMKKRKTSLMTTEQTYSFNRF